jgi:beta-galactosidase
MNKLSFFISVLLITNSLFGQTVTRDSLFNFDWEFHKGGIKDAENKEFKDIDWRLVDLPHDWSIEDLDIADTTNNRIISGPFDSKAIGGKNSGFTVGGTGWYRKHFELSQKDTGKIVYITFDGVYMNADVWINGYYLGNHPYGYTAFYYDITKLLYYGEKNNVIAVEVKNEGINSRWYSGSGIYRDVTLSIVDKIHAAPWGIFVSTPMIDSESSKVQVVSLLNNGTSSWQDIKYVIKVFSPDNTIVAQKEITTRLDRHVASNIKTELKVDNPKLWSPETPNLYKLVCCIKQEDKELDRTETRFGIRSITFDAEKGMFLNGKSIKLKGGSMHANNGPLGAAAYNRAEERRVEIMKNRGFNAVRCGHNPPSTAFLNACDRLGLLVIDESFDVWTVGWLPDDYHIYFNDWWKSDTKSMVTRDRNHPSIFAWSIGNQLRENTDSIGIALAYEMSSLVKTIDNTRPVTANIIVPEMKRNAKPELWYNCDPFFAALDICGYSYQSENYTDDHKRLPDRIMFSSEIDPGNSFDNWMKAVDNDYIIGNFEWTAMDFMGEVSLGWYAFTEPKSKAMWPWTSTYSGDFDICGFRRPRSYYRDILFRHDTKISEFVYSPVPSFEGDNVSRWGWDDIKKSWTWPEYEGKPLQVIVYSAYDSVELHLNGKSLGKKQTNRSTEFKAIWSVPYKKGSLIATGFIGNSKAETCELITTGKPYKIKLTPDRNTIAANKQDMCFITVEILDKNGNLIPNAENVVKFTIKGKGKIAATGNGNPVSIESFQQPFRKVYEGKCLLIVKSTEMEGTMEITAESKGLRTDMLKITAIK